jgi:hypothetical protein
MVDSSDICETWLGRVKHFFEHHWGIAVATFTALSAYVGIRKAIDHRQRQHIDEVADAVRQQVSRLAIEQGAAAAHQAVAQTYGAELSRLSDQQSKEASLLMRNPEELAAYIVKVTGSVKFPTSGVPGSDSPETLH